MCTTIYTLSVSDPYFTTVWGATNNLSSLTYVYWNTPIYSPITPNYSNPIIFSNTYNNTGSSFTTTIYVMCDNVCAFYLNGTLIGNNGAYPNGYSYNITIASGINTFKFYCENQGSGPNPAGFAVNMYNNISTLLMNTDSTCSGGTVCSGWTCVIGGFFKNNQPLLTFYQIGGQSTASSYASNAGDIQNGFASGTTSSNSNYKVNGSDLSTINAPCIPVISGLSSNNTSITISWYYFGLCNSYTIYYGTTSPPTTTSTISSGSFWEASNTNTNSSTGQKYCNYSSSVGGIFQTGYNTYTITGLTSITSYSLYVLCSFNTIDANAAATNQLSTSTGSSTSAVTSYSTTGPIATGGTITTSGNYKIHTFTSSGTFTVTSGLSSINVLVVAGGGGGGASQGGGGGAGGLIYNTAYSVTNTAYTVTVGAGGTCGSYSPYSAQLGQNGGNSVFNTLTAIGGGGATGQSAANSGISSSAGGSGGGASRRLTFGAGTTGQGNSGGTFTSYGTGEPGSNSYFNSGGGGGAGAVGGNASSSSAGNGGNGLQYSISGTNTYYAGGGGGCVELYGSSSATNGTGGLGGGGAGGVSGNGSPNTGGGGGGATKNNTPGNGGSGIVIISYLYQ